MKIPLKTLQYTSLAIAVCSFIMTMLLFTRLVSGVDTTSRRRTCSRHILLYVPEHQSSYFADMEKGARAAAAQIDAALSVYVLDREGIALTAARSIKPDGIIVCPEADDERTLESLLAIRAAGIPVVIANHRVKSDIPWTWVGANAHEYGKKLATRLPEPGSGRLNVAIVYSEKAPGLKAERELLEMGIHSVRPARTIDLEVLETGLNPRDAERVVWEQLKKRPDTQWFIFTDSGDTLAGAQALVDLNLVGKVRVIGFGRHPDLLPWLDKGIIEACLFIDSQAIGASAVRSLGELYETGYTSSAVDTGISISDREAVSRTGDRP